jgi:hypothetical protein
MTRLHKLVVGAATTIGLLSALCTGPQAQTVIEEWGTAKFFRPPPPPHPPNNKRKTNPPQGGI